MAHTTQCMADALLRPAPVPRGLAFKAASARSPARSLTIVAGEGRSANRTKWASPELAGSGSGAAVLERPQEGQPGQQAPAEQLSASDLVRGAARGQRLPCAWPHPAAARSRCGLNLQSMCLAFGVYSPFKRAGTPDTDLPAAGACARLTNFQQRLVQVWACAEDVRPLFADIDRWVQCLERR